MFKWLNVLLTLVLSLFSLWALSTLFETYSSPLYTQAHWIKGVEMGDSALVQKWSKWNGRQLTIEEAEELINAFHTKPKIRKLVYEEIQKAALDLHYKRPRASSWFNLDKQYNDRTYSVIIPSFEVIIESPFLEQLNVKIDQHDYELVEDKIGPLLPLNYEFEFTLQTELGEIREFKRLETEDYWHEDEVVIEPKFMTTGFTVTTSSLGGTIFLDGKPIDELRESAEIGPIPYGEHHIYLERYLPWGRVTSEVTTIRPQQDYISIPLPYINEELITQLGETLVNYNNGWVKAVKDHNVVHLTSIDQPLLKMMTNIISQFKHEVFFSGHFMQLILYPSSIEIFEPEPDQLEVKVIVREDYVMSKWLSSTDEHLMDYPEKQMWEYWLRYSEGEGWLITDFIEPEVGLLEQDEGVAFHGREVLRMGIDASIPPFGYIDSKQNLTGFDIDFMNQLAQELNINIYWHDKPLDQALIYVPMDPELDGIISAVTGEKREEYSEDWTFIPYLELGNELHEQYFILIRKDLDEVAKFLEEGIQKFITMHGQEYESLKAIYFPF